MGKTKSTQGNGEPRGLEMKQFILVLVFFAYFVSSLASAQTGFNSIIVNGSASIGNKTAADSKAVLDVKSTTKGFLPPRMTTVQRDAISSPPTGLTIFNTTTNKINAYSGTSWGEVGGGAGGIFAGGQNLITNNSFETDTAGWTASGGTFQRETGAGNIIPPGVGSASWDPSATAQTLAFTATTITSNDGISARNGVVSCSIKTAATDLLIQAFDGTTNVASQAVTSSSAGFVRTSVNFIFPSSGTIQIRFSSQSNSAIAYIDDCFLGLAEGFNISQVNQATLFGKVSSVGAAGCNWQIVSPTTSYAAFSADSDCNVATATGAASAPATKIPAITFTSLPPGRYLFMVRSTGEYIAIDGGSETDLGGNFRLHDGTNGIGGLHLRCIQASFCSANEFSGEIEYTTTQSNITIQMQFKRNTTASTAYIANSPTTDKFEISVYRYPTVSETLLSPGAQRLPTVQVLTSGTTYTRPAGVSAIRVRGTAGGGGGSGGGVGSPTAGSAGGTTSFGTSLLSATGGGGGSPATVTGTGGAGGVGTVTSPAIGVGMTGNPGGNFNQSPSGGFSGAMSGGQGCIFGGGGRGGNQSVGGAGATNSGGGGGGGGHTSSGLYNGSGGGAGGCFDAWIINPDSSYTYAIGASGAGGNAGTNASAGGAGAAGQIVVDEFYGSISFPILVGSVTSNSSGTERIERALMNLTSGSSCVADSQSGTWVSSAARPALGVCTLTIASGIFSATPTCTCIAQNGGSGRFCIVDTTTTPSATTMRFRLSNTSDTGVDDRFHAVCMGPR